MGMWSFLLASALASASGQPAGHYVAVTEAEYELELTIATSGRAELENHMWEADHSAPDSRTRLEGRWVLHGNTIKVTFPSGQTASFRLETCLSYSEFGRSGCSPGLKLIATNLPLRWGLQRFGLWRSDLLRSGV